MPRTLPLGTEPVGDLNAAADALSAWLFEYLDVPTCETLSELHPDTWREIAEVAVRAARGERDARPFTTAPEFTEAPTDAFEPCDEYPFGLAGAEVTRRAPEPAVVKRPPAEAYQPALFTSELSRRARSV